MQVILLWDELVCHLQTDTNGFLHFLLGGKWRPKKKTLASDRFLGDTRKHREPCQRSWFDKDLLSPVLQEVFNPCGDVWVYPHVFHFALLRQLYWEFFLYTLLKTSNATFIILPTSSIIIIWVILNLQYIKFKAFKSIFWKLKNMCLSFV